MWHGYYNNSLKIYYTVALLLTAFEFNSCLLCYHFSCSAFQCIRNVYTEELSILPVSVLANVVFLIVSAAMSVVHFTVFLQSARPFVAISIVLQLDEMLISYAMWAFLYPSSMSWYPTMKEVEKMGENLTTVKHFMNQLCFAFTETMLCHVNMKNKL